MRKYLRRYFFDIDILRMMGIVVLVKPLGLITQMLLAKYFGAGPQYDAYALALFIVSFNVMVLGNVYISAAIPFVIKLRAKMSALVMQQFQAGVTLLFLAPAFVITSVLLIWPAIAVDIAGPGLPRVTREYTIGMVRILALPGALLMVSMLGKAVLNMNRRYQLVVSMPLLNAILMLAAISLLHRQLGIWALPLGYGVSQLCQATVQWWWAVRSGLVVLARPQFPPGTKKKLWSLSWMLMLTQAIVLLNQFIDKMFASSLESGSISSIAYANTIVLFGVQIFAFTLLPVMFTKISEMIAEGDIKVCSDYILDNMGRVSRLAIPVALSLCLASGEIVRTLFQRGAFTPEDSERTSAALAMYVLGLTAYVMNQMTSRVFHALQRMKEKIWLALQYLVTKVVLNAILIGSLRVTGLAISASVAIYVHVILSLWVLHRYRIGLQVDRWSAMLLKNHLLALATYLLYIVTGFSGLMAQWSVKGTLAGDITIGIAKTGFVFVTYFALFLAWRTFWGRIVKR